jgi:chorismate mutase
MGREELQELRGKIDALDSELLRVLAKRFDVISEIRELKKMNNLPARDEDRWQEVLSTRLTEAEGLGLPPAFARKVLEAIHERSLEIEK